MKNSIKSKVMKAAWTIFRKMEATMANWSKALKKAWAWAKRVLAKPSGYSGYKTIKETEKAICVSASLICVHTDQVVRNNIWVPKSIIKNDTIPQWFVDKKSDEAISNHSYYGNGGSSLQFGFN